MTLAELNEEVNYLLGGEPVNLMTIYKLANKGMDVLANRYDTACIQKETTINCTDANAEYALPDDCIGVYNVKSNGTKYNYYSINEGLISFNKIDLFAIKYYASPVMPIRKDYDFNLKSDVLPIKSAYLKCLSKYIAVEALKYATSTTYKYRGMVRYMSDPKIEIYTRDFMQESQEADSRLKRLKRRNTRIKAPLWR